MADVAPRDVGERSKLNVSDQSTASLLQKISADNHPVISD